MRILTTYFALCALLTFIIMGFFDELGSSVAKGLGSAASGLFGSTIGSIFQNSQNKKLMKMQAEQQEKMARLTNQLENESWNSRFEAQNAREDWLNANSAMIQKQALKDAGINTASLGDDYQLGGASMSSAANPSGSSPSLGSFGQAQSLSDWYGQGLAARKLQSEIDLIDAQKRNLDSKTTGQDIVNAFAKSREELQNDLLRMQKGALGAQIKLTDTQSAFGELQIEIKKELKPFEIESMAKTVEVQKATIKSLEAVTLKDKAEADYVNKQVEHFDENFENTQKEIISRVKSNLARANLDNTTANDIVKTCDARLGVLKATAKELNSRSDFNSSASFNQQQQGKLYSARFDVDSGWGYENAKSTYFMNEAKRATVELGNELTERYGDIKEISSIIGNVTSSFFNGSVGYKALNEGFNIANPTNPTVVRGFGQ